VPGVDVTRHLRRIGYDGPLDADHRTLAALQRAHLLAVPFDALDCHLGNPVTVEPADAYRKVVEHGRGGYCFELNGLFAWLLGELGFAVTLLAAQPAIGDDRYALPDAHLTLRVDLEHPSLVDVGFGRFAIAPLRIDSEAVQVCGDGRFRVVPDGDGLRAEELDTGDDPNAYRFTLTPRSRAFFAERCRDYSTDPQSPFVRSATVQQIFDDGWAGVRRDRHSGRRGGRVLDRPLADEADWRAELERQFGLVVDGTTVRGAGAVSP
jgi:N-hydroxyarylamine O-acetyltransferase